MRAPSARPFKTCSPDTPGSSGYFHYVYAVLHHPQYRECYAANLKRELPRIPFVGADGIATSDAKAEGGVGEDAALKRCSTQNRPMKALDMTKSRSLGAGAPCDDKNENGARGDRGENGVGGGDQAVFWVLVEAGRRLAELHVHYERQPEYPLQEIWKPGSKLNYRVEKMRLGRDKTSLIYNDDLTLAGIPPETFEYRLGNRSALDWIIDQYQVSTDKRSGIVNDPNREDDPQYILKLIKQVIYVSLETVKVVGAMPALFPGGKAASA